MTNQTKPDLVWVNLQMDSSANLIIWRGGDAIGIGADFAQEILEQTTLGEVQTALLYNGNITPTQAPRAVIADLWAQAHGEDEEETN